MRGPLQVNYPCIKLAFEPGSTQHEPYNLYRVVRNHQGFFPRSQWPDRTWYSPGAILDSDGSLFKVNDLTGWSDIPNWAGWTRYFFGLEGILFRLACRNLEMQLSVPIKMSLRDSKNFISLILYGNTNRNLLGEQRDAFDRTSSILATCQSHRALVEFVDWYQRTDAGLVT